MNPEQVDQFVADASTDAFEKFVDTLLSHPGYGEHMARGWLDLARYADSAGYADDPPRTIWPYRDWVIRAFDNNMPFDEFTIAQLAGDLLLDTTHDNKIATAFHRNTLTNNEGGTIDEEFRTFFFVACLHACEVAGTRAALRVVELASSEYSFSSQVPP